MLQLWHLIMFHCALNCLSDSLWLSLAISGYRTKKSICQFSSHRIGYSPTLKLILDLTG